MRFVLLPGLYGTERLFAPFLAAAPAGTQLLPVALPAEALGYPGLVDWASGVLGPDPTVVVAESFSGPLAIELAARHPSIRALVLCATFVDSPWPPTAVRLAAAFARVHPPLWLLRLLWTGGDAALARMVADVTAAVPTRTLAARLEAVRRVDVSAVLSGLRQPLLYLTGSADRIVSRAAVRRVLRAHPSIEHVEVEGPHLILQANPRGAWAAIEAFAARVDRPAG